MKHLQYQNFGQFGLSVFRKFHLLQNTDKPNITANNQSYPNSNFKERFCHFFCYFIFKKGKELG